MICLFDLKVKHTVQPDQTLPCYQANKQLKTIAPSSPSLRSQSRAYRYPCNFRTYSSYWSVIDFDFVAKQLQH